MLLNSLHTTARLGLAEVARAMLSMADGVCWTWRQTTIRLYYYTMLLLGYTTAHEADARSWLKEALSLFQGTAP